MGIKDIYFALEDRYYDAVEALHLNGVTDAIDRVVPSFAVLLIALLLILSGGIFWFASQPVTPPTPSSYSLTLSFSGQNGTAIANEQVLIRFADETTETLTTKSNGSINVKVKPAQSPIRIELNAAGYLPYSQEYAVTKNQSISIVLEGAPIALEGISRTILVQDEQGQLLGEDTPVSILVKFSCSNNPASTPADITTSQATINVSAPGDCGRITARVVVSGYRDKTAELFNSVTEMRLTPIPQQIQQGSIGIAIKGNDNAGIAAAQVRLYSVPATGTAQLENQGLTDSSGTFVFGNLNPGRYYVTATKQGFTLGQTPQQQLNAGQTLNLSLTLATSNNNKKFHVKVQNSGGIAIPQAVVNAFIENAQEQFILFSTAFTDANGLYTELVGDLNNSSSALVISHPNYVTEIVDPATLVAATDTTPLVVVLDAVTLGNNGLPTNAGNATVQVKNEVNFPIQSASAKLFVDDVNGLLVNTINTDASGNALFRNLPSGPYQARATKGNLSGISTIQGVANAQNKNFPVTLQTNQGGIEVIVADALTLAVLADVNVQFFAVGNANPIVTKTTDAQGRASASFDANKVVYAVVSKPGYYTLTTTYAPIIPGNVFTFPVALQPVGSVQGMSLELMRIWNISTPLTLAQSLQPGTSYLVEYRLTVPTGSTNPVRAHMRVGSEALNAPENTSSALDEIEIDDVTTLYGVPELSPNFQPSPQDPFVTLPPFQNGSAKVANVNFGNIPSGSQYQYFKWITIKPTAVNGQDVHFRFQAKDNSALITPLNLKTYTVGQALPQNLYGFSFYLKRVGTNSSIQLPENGSTPIINQNIYQLDYTLTNLSTATYNASSNVQLQFSQNVSVLQLGGTSPPLSTTSIQIPIASFTPGQIVNGTVYLQANIPNNGSLSSGTITAELLNVNGSLSQRRRTLGFNVAAAATLNVNVSPSSLTPGIMENLGVGIASAATSNPVQGIITLTLTDPTNPSVNTLVANTPLLSNPNGLTVIPVGPFTSGQSIQVNVTAPDHVPFNTNIPIGIPLSGAQQFGCVTVNNNPLSLSQGSGGQFSITTQNCAEPVNIRLRGTTSTNVNTIPGFGVLPSALNASGGIQSISVQSPSSVLGQFPVYVDAKFASQSAFVEIAEVKVLVQGLSNNCFALSSTGNGLYEYTLAGTGSNPLTANGTINNNCHIYVKDPSLPQFQLSNEPTLLVQSSTQNNAFLFTPITAAWSAQINANGYVPSGGGSGPAPIAGDINKWMEKYTPSSGKTRYNYINDTIGNMQSDGISGDSGSGTWEYTAWYSLQNPITVTASMNANQNGYAYLDSSTTPFISETGNAGGSSSASVTLPAGVHQIRVSLNDSSGDDFIFLSFNGLKLSQVVNQMAMNPASIGGTSNGPSTNSWLFTVPNATIPNLLTDTITLLPSTNTSQGDWLYETFYYLNQPKTFSLVHLKSDNLGRLYLDNATGTNYIVQDNDGSGNGANGFNTASNVTLPAGLHRLYITHNDSGGPEELHLKFTDAGTEKPLSQVVDFMSGYPDQFVFTVTPPPTPPISPTIASDSGSGSVLPSTSAPVVLSTLSSGFQTIQNGGIAESAIPNAQAFVSSLNLNDVPPSATDVHTYIHHNKVYGQYIGNETNNNGSLPFTLQSNGIAGSKYVTLQVQDYVRPSGALPPMKIVAIIDASSSFQSYYSSSCATINALRNNLKNTLYPNQAESMIETRIYYLGATTPGIVAGGCSINNQPQIPNSTVQFLGNTWALGTAHPYSATTDAYNEAWGNGITQALAQFPLTNATTNMVLLFTDSDPTGSENTATGNSYWRFDESAIVNETATLMNQSNTHGFAFYGVPETNSMTQVTPTNQLDVIDALDSWATGTNGFVEALESTSLNHGNVTQRMLRSLYGTQAQQFSVKVIGPSTSTGGNQNNLCYGPDNLVGTTNAIAVPKVSFEWRFQDLPAEACNADNVNGVYCDAVQFMISLYKKLNTLHANATAGNLSQVPTLTQFQARLIQDGYTEDLNKDFLAAYASGGALNNVLQWFVGANGSDVNFSRYAEEGRVTIEVIGGPTPTQLPSSGTYTVQLSFEWDNPQNPYVFFTPSGVPIARVHVTLTKVPNSEQGLDSPLYFLPFDGMVGYDPATNTFQREGYGLDYVGDLVPLRLGNSSNEVTQTYPNTQSGNAFGVLTTSNQSTFAQTNTYRRGKLLSIDRTAGTLTYSPSNATPVWTRFIPLNNELHNNFYWVKETPLAGGATSFVNAPANTTALSAWKAFASTSTITNPSNTATPYCASLAGTLLPNSINDATASSLGSNNHCALVSTLGLTSSQAFGFSYNNQPSAGQLAYRSVFYTPVQNTYQIGAACNNASQQGEFHTPLGLIGQSGSPLDYSTQNNWGNVAGPGINPTSMSMSRLFNLVQNGFLCVSSSAQQMDVFWNEGRVLQELQNSYGNPANFPLANACNNP